VDESRNFAAPDADVGEHVIVEHLEAAHRMAAQEPHAKHSASSAH
jgi:hypothetical protein